MSLNERMVGWFSGGTKQGEVMAFIKKQNSVDQHYKYRAKKEEIFLKRGKTKTSIGMGWAIYAKKL